MSRKKPQVLFTMEEKDDFLFSMPEYEKGSTGYSYTGEERVIWTQWKSYSTDAIKSLVYMQIRKESRMMFVILGLIYFKGNMPLY